MQKLVARGSFRSHFLPSLKPLKPLKPWLSLFSLLSLSFLGIGATIFLRIGAAGLAWPGRTRKRTSTPHLSFTELVETCLDFRRRSSSFAETSAVAWALKVAPEQWRAPDAFKELLLREPQAQSSQLSGPGRFCSFELSPVLSKCEATHSDAAGGSEQKILGRHWTCSLAKT